MYQRKWRAENVERSRTIVRRQAAANTKRIRTWMMEYFTNHPCIDCGETDPVVLEFDHRDPTTKVAAVSQMIPSNSLAVVKQEVAKCDVRCANCHRRKNAKDQNWYSYLT